jgi:hypothetical protein
MSASLNSNSLRTTAEPGTGGRGAKEVVAARLLSLLSSLLLLLLLLLPPSCSCSFPFTPACKTDDGDKGDDDADDEDEEAAAAVGRGAAVSSVTAGATAMEVPGWPWSENTSGFHITTC